MKRTKCRCRASLLLVQFNKLSFIVFSVMSFSYLAFMQCSDFAATFAENVKTILRKVFFIYFYRQITAGFTDSQSSFEIVINYLQLLGIETQLQNHDVRMVVMQMWSQPYCC